MDNKVSVRGRMARKMVEIANNISSVTEEGSKSELRAKLLDKEWKCPEKLQLIGIEMDNFFMELLRNATETLHYVPNKRGIILQFHGGGYYLDMNNSYRDMAIKYNDVSAGMDVLTIDYRVSPEFPYPAALEDAVEAYIWTLNQGYDATDVIIAGDSAGGGLGLALCLYLREHDFPMPKCIITMSAWTDLTCSGESYKDNFDVDPVFGGNRDSLVFQNEYYRNDTPDNPYISPVFGEFHGFPKMLMQVGEYEMLLSDTITVAQKAQAAGVDVNMHIYPGMFHVFQKGMNMYPESKKAWEEIRDFLNDKESA